MNGVLIRRGDQNRHILRKSYVKAEGKGLTSASQGERPQKKPTLLTP